MTVFNSFFLLFKNDAAKSKKDVADLEKQIDSLRAKGKARSAEENAQMKEATKRHKEIQQQMKETQNSTEKLGDSIASAAAAYVSFSAIKAGIVNTAEFNRNLSVQSKNLNQNTQDLRAYSAMVEKAGGSQEAFLGFIDSKTKQAASAGLPFDQKVYLQNLRKYIEGMTPNNKLAVLQQEGVTDQGLIRRLMGSQEEWDEAIADAYKYAQATEAADKASREFGESQNQLSQAIRSYWGKVGEVVLPVLTQGNKGMTDMVMNVSKDKQASIEAFGAMGSAALFLSTGFFGIARGILSMGGAVGGVAARAAGLIGVLSRALGLLAIIGTEGAMIYGGVKDVRNGTRKSLLGKGAHWLAGQLDSDIRRQDEMVEKAAGGGRSGDTGGDAMAFWMSQGYTRAQAAGIIANEMHESGGDPNARGDGGQAHGLFQWHPDRRAKIMRATGIDVSNASAMDQRKAAAWEMKNEGIFSDDAFRGIQSPDAAAAYFTRNFERPADIGGQSLLRAQTALGIASDSSLGAQGAAGGSNSSVKIDKIEVNTQATDAQGIANDIGDELGRVLGFSYGNLDDGVAG